MTHQSDSSSSHVRMVSAAAASLGVVYLLLRYFASGTTALLLAQFVFLAAPVAACVLSAWAALVVPAGNRERTMWWLITAANALLLVTEIVYSVRTLGGLTMAGPVGGIADLAAGAATAIFIILVAVLPTLNPLDPQRAWRSLTEMGAAAVLACMFVFRFGVVPIVEAGELGIVEAIRLAVYAAVGVFVMVGDVLNIGLLDRTRPPRRSYLGWGVGIYGLGVALWPVWQLAPGMPRVAWSEHLASVLYFVGYALFALAAAARIDRPNAPLRSGSALTLRGELWPRLVGVTVIAAAIVGLSWAARSADPLGAEHLVYVGGLLVATMLIVIRTAVGSAEVLQLRALAGTDTVTGAYNRERLEERVAERRAMLRRFGEPYLVAVLDIDDLGAVNRSHGASAGDVVLAEVAERLTDVAGSESVFRVGSDEFVVVVASESTPHAAVVAQLLLDAVARAQVDEKSVSASLGYCVGTADDADRDCVADASEAQLWAKTHGKHRAVAYDSAAMRSAGSSHGVPWERLTDPNLARGLLSLASAGDPVNPWHAQNVAALVALVARDLGLDEIEGARLELAALLHDIGKLAIPDVPDTRRSHRSAQLARREHPELGARMVEALEVEGLAECVRAHHERWDGTGYPRGLAGELIPLGARMLALADAYDGMTAAGSQRQPISKYAALQEIDQGLGSRFDPVLGERFIALVSASEPFGWIEERGLGLVGT